MAGGDSAAPITMPRHRAHRPGRETSSRDRRSRPARRSGRAGPRGGTTRRHVVLGDAVRAARVERWVVEGRLDQLAVGDQRPVERLDPLRGDEGGERVLVEEEDVDAPGCEVGARRRDHRHLHVEPLRELRDPGRGHRSRRHSEQSSGSGTCAFRPRDANVCGAALDPGREQPASTSGAAAASSWRRVRCTRGLWQGPALRAGGPCQATSRSDDSAATSSASTDPHSPQWSPTRPPARSIAHMRALQTGHAGRRSGRRTRASARARSTTSSSVGSEEGRCGH